MLMPKHKKSFTIIEISIVVVISSCILLVIIASKNLIDAVKSNQLYQNLLYYKQAITTFNNVYGALPGDITISGLAVSGAEQAKYRFQYADPSTTLGYNFSSPQDGVVIGCDSRDGFRQMFLSSIIDKKLFSNPDITIPAQCSLLTNTGAVNTQQYLDIGNDIGISLPKVSFDKNIGITYSTYNQSINNTILGPNLSGSDILITLFGARNISFYAYKNRYNLINTANAITPTSVTNANTTTTDAQTAINNLVYDLNNISNPANCYQLSGNCGSSYYYFQTNGGCGNSNAIGWLCYSVNSILNDLTLSRNAIITASTATSLLASSSLIGSSTTVAINNATTAATNANTAYSNLSSLMSNLSAGCSSNCSLLSGQVANLISTGPNYAAQLTQSLTTIQASNSMLFNSSFKSTDLLKANPSFPSISSKMAFKIDQKYDDGLPLTGSIISTKGWDQATGTFGESNTSPNPNWCNDSNVPLPSNLSSAQYKLGNKADKTGCITSMTFTLS